MKASIALGFILCMAPLFTGCNPDIAGTSKPFLSEYATEKRSIKSSVTTQASLESKIKALQGKYGISPVDASKGGNKPDIIKPAACALCSKDSTPTAHPPPLPKKAATVQYDIFGIKNTSTEIERPYYGEYYIPAGETFTVDVTGAETSVDPFLVIYEIDSGSVYDYRSQLHLDVLGYNDDYSGLNPHVSIGPFDSPKYVYVLAFAYDIYSKGQADITVQTGGTTETGTGIWIKGNAIFHDNDHGQEIDKSGNMVNLQDEGWGSYLPGTTVFTAANYNYWTGDYNWGAYVPSCTGDSYIWAFNLSGMRGMANDDSPEGLCSSVWNDASWTPFPIGYHYPNFVLIGGYSDGGTANFLQISAFQR